MKKTLWVILSVLIASGAAAGSAYFAAQRVRDAGEKKSAVITAPAAEEPRSEVKETAGSVSMLEKLLPSVVGISTATTVSGPFSYNKNEEWNMGSGIIATDDGYIVTNQHVVGARPDRILVTLSGGETFEGRTVWSDASLDLAVIKINGSGFVAAQLGSVHGLKVGQSVFAVGNPLSMQFERTVTSGIVSALNRTISVSTDGRENFMEDLIQTDASINPGNSGGPLVDGTGQVIGINTIKVTEAEGMGFAVPINLCAPIIERIKAVGEFNTPYLGLYAYTAAAARYIKQDSDFEKGLYIAQLDTTGPAFGAGLRQGDILTRVNDREVNTMLELREELFQRQGGESVQITFIRDQSARRVTVVLTPQNLVR